MSFFLIFSLFLKTSLIIPGSVNDYSSDGLEEIQGIILEQKAVLEEVDGLDSPLIMTYITISNESLDGNNSDNVNLIIPGGKFNSITMKFSNSGFFHDGDYVSCKKSEFFGIRYLYFCTLIQRAYITEDPVVLKNSSQGAVFETTSSGKVLKWPFKSIFFTPDIKLGTVLNDIVINSAAKWMDSIENFSSLELYVDTPEDISPGFNSKGINYNSISIVNDNWIRGVDTDGFTILTYIDNPDSERDGELLDADIILNGTDGRFGNSTADGTFENTVIMHEMGHVIGLEHPCNTDSDLIDDKILFCDDPEIDVDVLNSVMFPFSYSQNTNPNNLDISGVESLFPLGDDRTESRVDLREDNPGCSCSAGSNHSEISLSLLFLFLMLFIRFNIRS